MAGEFNRDDEAVSRLLAWIRDYRHLKQPVFAEDMDRVLSLAREARRKGIVSELDSVNEGNGSTVNDSGKQVAAFHPAM